MRFVPRIHGCVKYLLVPRPIRDLIALFLLVPSTHLDSYSLAADLTTAHHVRETTIRRRGLS